MSQPHRVDGHSAITIPPPAEMSGIVRGPTLPHGLRFAGPLGEGSIGRVVGAYSPRNGELVAVKLLSQDYLANPEQRVRLLAEAAAASRLSSEHVAKVFDAGEMDDGSPYIVMEYLEGCTLEEHIQRRGPMSVPFAIECIMQALDALAEAHALGLVHRDIKPANLFLVGSPEEAAPKVKVLDFGIVKDLVSTQKHGRITKEGNVMGTPAYMAPEQLDARPDVDWRADVWAIGVTLFQMLTGDVPFTGRSVPRILTAILSDPMPSIRARRPDVSERLERIIARCLSKSRDGRFSSAAELSLALGAEIF